MNILNHKEDSNLQTTLLNDIGYETYQEANNNVTLYPEDHTIVSSSNNPYVLLANGEVKLIDKWDVEVKE